jgi:glutaminase
VDSERLFEMAFPDGLDLDENKVLETLEDYLKESNSISKKSIDSIFDSVLNKTDVEIKSMNPMLVNATRIVISSLLQRRKLI